MLEVLKQNNYMKRSNWGRWRQGTAQFAVSEFESPDWEFPIADLNFNESLARVLS